MPVMSHAEPDSPIDRIARNHGERGWRVARTMMGDDADASDVLQQAFLVVAARSGGVPAGEPWPWFCTVIVNCARNARRVRARRRARMTGDDMPHEHPDPEAMDPASAAAKAELGELLRAAVAELPEAERDAITLTHLGGLSTQQAADAMGVPRNTLKSYCHRGVGRLRERLGRRAGIESEEGIAAALAALPVAIPAGGMAEFLGGAAEAAKGLSAMAGSAGAGAGVAAGATVMASKGMMAAVLAVGLVLGGASGAVIAGLAGGDERPGSGAAEGVHLAGTGGGASDAAGGAGANGGPVKDVAALEATVAGLRRQLGEAEAARQLAAREAEQVRAERGKDLARIGEIEARLAELTARPARKLPVGFGPDEQQAALAGGDWNALAASMRSVIEAAQETARLEDKGETVPRELELRLINVRDDFKRRAAPLQLAAAEALPGHGVYGTSVLTHPLYLSNIIAGILQAGDKPLSEAQAGRLAALGGEFQKTWDARQKTYGDDTLKLEKIADELELKQRFVNDAMAVLSAEQGALLGDASLRGVRGADPLSPLLLLEDSWELYYGDGRATLKSGMMSYAAKLAGVDESFMAGADFLFETYLTDLGDTIRPLTYEKASRFTVAEALTSVRAQTRLMRSFLQAMPLTEGVAGLIRNTSRVMIMRQVDWGAPGRIVVTDEGK